MIDTTQIASFQFMVNRKILVPIITKSDDTIEEIACETNIFTESMSEVRFVNNFEGFAFCINAKLCREILSEKRLRRSRATLSEV